MNCSNVLRMKRVLMSSAELGLAVRPTHILGSSRWAATMQMPITAGNMGKTASLMTRAIRSPSVQSSGTQCQKSLAKPKNRAEKTQFPTRTKINGNWRAVKPKYCVRGSRRLLARRFGACRSSMDRCMFPSSKLQASHPLEAGRAARKPHLVIVFLRHRARGAKPQDARLDDLEQNVYKIPMASGLRPGLWTGWTEALPSGGWRLAGGRLGWTLWDCAGA